MAKRHYPKEGSSLRGGKYEDGRHGGARDADRNYYDGRPMEMQSEKIDGGMIGNDYTKIANLPTEVMMKAYPPCPAGMDYDMQDNIKGVDRQLAADNAARVRGFDPHKY